MKVNFKQIYFAIGLYLIIVAGFLVWLCLEYLSLPASGKTKTSSIPQLDKILLNHNYEILKTREKLDYQAENIDLQLYKFGNLEPLINETK